MGLELSDFSVLGSNAFDELLVLVALALKLVDLALEIFDLVELGCVLFLEEVNSHFLVGAREILD